MTATTINTKLATGLERVANGELQIVFTANADAAALDKPERDKIVRATYGSVHGLDANAARSQAARTCAFWGCAAAFHRIADDQTSTFLQDGNRTVTTGKALGDALKAARQQALADLQAAHDGVDMKLADMPSTSGENYAWATTVAKLADEGSPADILRMFQTGGVAAFLTERAEAFMRKPGGAIARAEADKSEAERVESEKAMVAEAEKARTAEAEAAKAEAEAAKAEAAKAKAEAEAAKAQLSRDIAAAAKVKDGTAAPQTAGDGTPGGKLAGKPTHGKPDPMTPRQGPGAASAAPSDRPDNGDERPFPNVEVARRETALCIGKALAAGIAADDLVKMVRDQADAQARAAKPDAAPQGKAKGKGGVSVKATPAKGVTANSLQSLGAALDAL